MSGDIAKMLHENKLELLTDQNLELKRQIEMLKNTNEALLEGIRQSENTRQEALTLTLRNLELTDLLQAERRRSQQLQTRRYEQTMKLREQLSDKCNFIERMQIENEKKVFRLKEELKNAYSMMRQKRYDNMQDMSRSITASSCLIDNRGDENSMEKSHHYTQYDRFSNTQFERSSQFTQFERSTSKSPIHSRISQAPKGKENMKITHCMKPQELRNFSRQQIKVALKALNKAGKSLREGNMEVSMLKSRQSEMKSHYHHRK